MSTDGGRADVATEGIEQTIGNNIKEQCYNQLSKKLLNDGGWRDEIELTTGSQMSTEAHENRTVLELVQNARDAIRKGPAGEDDSRREGSVAVVVGPETLYVANTGQGFRLDQEDILRRVRRLGQGKEEEETIGEKGVGMRSIMALGERFGIHSTIPEQADGTYFSVDFTGAHPWAMLTRRYGEILRTSDEETWKTILGEMDDNETHAAYAERLETVSERLETRASEYHTLSDSDEWPGVDEIEQDRNETAPTPSEIIAELPNLSPFKYPYVREEPTGDPILNTLLGRDDPGAPTSEALADQVSEEQYTTVISVDYSDDAWSSLLDLFIEAFDDTDPSLDVPVEEWRETDENRSGETEQAAQEQVWEECKETITEEVLILLGEIETIDLVRLNDREDSASYESYTIRDDTDSHDATDPGGLRSQQVTVTRSAATESKTENGSESVFYLYMKPWKESPADSDESGLLKILYEEPQVDEGWCPRPQPLHLYYPIEKAETPFPFVVHAPFEVQMDRQNLDSENPKNEKLLDDGDIQEFVIETVEEIMNDEPGLRPWLPWLMMPLMAGDRANRGRQSIVTTFIDDLCEELADTTCIPTFGGGKAVPGQVLLEVSGQRLEAFEPVREYLIDKGKDEHERLPARKVIKNGKEWFETISQEGVMEEDRFCTAVERIGVTGLLNQLPGDENTAGESDFISVLGDIWGIDSGDEDSNPDIAVKAEDASARVYFETIINRLPDEGASSVAGELGERHIPLLPALDYTERNSEEPTDDIAGEEESSEATNSEKIGYLVRAINRNEISVIDRIVFREDSSEIQREIDPPPSPFDVYLIPYQKEWYGALDDNAEEWGTSKFESETDIYRRVASELGGYGENKITKAKDRSEALEYLYNGYTEINAEKGGVSAELFHPVPFQGRHYHKKFSNSTDINGIGNLLRGEKLKGIDDENYLQQVYIKTAGIPTTDEEWTPASQITFGQEWADIFTLVAEELETGVIDDPFEERRLGDTSSTEDFRRWGMAIGFAASIQDEDASVLARPTVVCEHLGIPVNDESVREDLSGGEGFWLLNFLLHLGVQVGPRIEWAWLNPANSQSDDRRPGALSLEEARQLSKGRVPETDTADLPLTPTEDELKRYANLCRRARNHPAFVVGHASDCGENAKQAYDEWSVYDAAYSGHRLAIPMWWRFADPPSELDQASAGAFRNAVLLLWPELSDRLFPTGWVCAGAFGNSHQVKSPRRWIPSLGLVQLRQASIWPSKNDEDENVNLMEATKLVNEKRIKEVIEFDYAELTAELPDEDKQQEDFPALEDVAAESDLGKWLGLSIDELDPAAAAERLDNLLGRYEIDQGQYTQFRDDAFKLLRQFPTDDHVGIISEKKDRRKWMRRDIYHTETRVFVNNEGRPEPTQIGENHLVEATVYSKALPGYAREQLNKSETAVVELPSGNQRSQIATILEDVDEGRRFGINGKPVPKRSKLTSGSVDEKLRDKKFNEALNDRVADLAAAYAVETNETKEEVQRLEKRLSEAVENVCMVSKSEVDGKVAGVKSVEWVLGSEEKEAGVGIALLKKETHGEFEPYHTVDALVDIVGNEAVKDKFEVVLRADPRMERYEPIKRDYELGNIEANELTELYKECLPVIATSVGDTLSESDAEIHEFELPDEKEQVKSTHDALKRFADEGSESELIGELVSELSRGILNQDQAEACLRAAIALAFERDGNAATATLLNVLLEQDTDIAAVIEGIADSIDAVDLTDWHAVNAESLRSYLTAVAMVEEFYSQVEMDLDEDGVRAKGDNVYARRDSLQPSPLEVVEDVLPEGVHTKLDIDRSLPIIAFELLDELNIKDPLLATGLEAESDYRANFGDVVDNWCRDKHHTIKAPVEPALAGETLCEHLNRWPGDGEGALDGVKGVLQPDAKRSARENKRTRKRKEQAFDEGEPFEKVQTEKDAAIDAVGFPEVGSGRRGNAENSEVPAGDGRAGELSCIKTAWKHFEAAEEQQDAIIEEISRWRDECSENDEWRLKRTADVFQDSAEFTNSTGEFDFETFRQRLCDESEDWKNRRKWFRMLVDASEESGPGFDYIDPFGPHPSDETDPNDWKPDWMRRVEVKSIDSEPGGSYRITLTGNEFRMARRSCDICENRRYLVRLVFGNRTDEGFEPTVSHDIDDILRNFSAAEDDLQQAEVRAWDALRGGRVPMSGSFE